MFLILNSSKRIVDITDHAQYVRRQKNGVVVGCTEANADAIYSDATDKFYPIRPIDFISDGYSLVEVVEVPDEVKAGYYFYHAGNFYTTEEDLAELAKPTSEQEIAALKQQNAALESQLTDTQLALCDFYESVVV